MNEALKIIETLRSGVPTRSSTKGLPDLRADLMKEIREDLKILADGNVPKGRMVWGQYGQGKSHFLKVIEHYALEMNFVVSSITLSREVSCHNLFNFYRRVAPIVRIPDSNIPGIQKKIAGLKISDLPTTPIQNDSRYSHRLPAVTFEIALKASEAEEFYDLYNCIMGDKLPLNEIRRFARKNEIADLLKGLPRMNAESADAYFGVFADIIKFCGYKGWVILIDELELISRLGRQGRFKAYKNLNWLLNWSEELDYPIYSIGASASSLQEVWFGDSAHRGQDTITIPEIAENTGGSNLRNQMEGFFKRALSTRCLTLIPIDIIHLGDICGKLIEFHSSAYEWNAPSNEVVKSAISGLAKDVPIRTYIRAVIEALDQIYVSGESEPIETAKLVEYTTEENGDYFQIDTDEK